MKRCLAKEPRKRVADISVALFALEQAEDGSILPAARDREAAALLAQNEAAVASTLARTRRRVVLVAAGAAVIVGAISAATAWYVTRPRPARVIERRSQPRATPR